MIHLRKENPDLKQYFDTKGEKIVVDHAQEPSFGQSIEIDPNYPFESNAFFAKDSTSELPEIEDINEQLATKQIGNPRNKL